MTCNNYGKCEHCEFDSNCEVDHMRSSNGDAYCDKFSCTVDDCKKSICITEEEEI